MTHLRRVLVATAAVVLAAGLVLDLARREAVSEYSGVSHHGLHVGAVIGRVPLYVREDELAAVLDPVQQLHDGTRSRSCHHPVRGAEEATVAQSSSVSSSS